MICCDVLVRVGRDDEPLRGPLGRQLVGEPLHLDRVLDAGLLLRLTAPSAPQNRVASIAASRSWSKETLTSIIMSRSASARPAFSAPSRTAGSSVSV